jgi:ABC-2 type transport system permease protein
VKVPVDFGRVREIVRKELLQIRRDPRVLRVVFVAPILQLVVFGYAVTTDVRRVPTFVVDHDHTATSREFLDTFVASGHFHIAGRSERPRDLVRALDHGRALVGVQIPRGFARDVAAGHDARVQLLFDGTNSNTATVAMGYADRIVQSFALRRAAGAAAPPVDLRPRAWYNPDLASQDYNVPAVMGGLMMLLSLLLTSLAVVRERELGTLEQLMVSPLRARELIAGKTVPFALIGLVDMVLITIMALIWFRVPFEGNVLLLLLGGVLFLLPALGLGLLISTIASTQQEAFLTTFFIFQPSLLLSGFMFPVSSMPVLFQWLTLANPLRHFLEIVRGIFLKGAGLDVLWPQYLALLVMGAGVLLFASTRFHKTIG